MMDENASVEKLRQENQPKCANDIREAISIGFHLKCLRCGAVYYHTQFAMSEMSYQMYSYCPNCIGEALDLLKKTRKRSVFVEGIVVREIMFRAKRVDNGEWVYGQYINARGPHDPEGETRHYIVEYPDPWHEIYTGTLGQYTGLRDKNGKRIFEGDIVRFQFDNDDCPWPNKRTEKHLGRVFWQEYRSNFSIAMGPKGSTMLNNDLWNYVQNGNRVEVIGNKYDDKELLNSV